MILSFIHKYDFYHIFIDLSTILMIVFRYCLTLWKNNHWVCKGLGDAYNRLIKPWLSRQIRSNLTIAAQKEAVKTFTNNLEKFLLTEPIKNKVIAGLDPGFKAGCKVNLISLFYE